MMTLQTIWFILVGVLLIGYAILDGFDLGAGNLILAAPKDKRSTIINAVGPFWDGNEVWLLTGGGAIFAAFPEVYATVFSGFYLALMLLLVALIMRAASVEFRNKLEDEGWRAKWDVGFFVGSLLISILLGVAFGNILRGIPVDGTKEFTGNFFTLLNPYAVLIGLLSLCMFTAQGAIYIGARTEGELHDWARRWAFRAWLAMAVLYVLATVASYFVSPFLFDRYKEGILPWAVVLVTVAAMGYTGYSIAGGRLKAAFASSSLTIAGMIGIAAVGLFPAMVPSSTDSAFTMTVMNSSSSYRTLSTMLLLAAIGVPIVLAYTAYIYRSFLKGGVSDIEY